METQYNQSQYLTLMKQNCTHNPSTSQVRKSNHPNPVAFPYPPDPGEHGLERSTTPTALVERDKLDLSSLAPPKGEMESSFSWTYPFKSLTSSTLCFGEPTLRKPNQVKLLCNPISSTLCDFTLGKLSQETEFHITKCLLHEQPTKLICTHLFYQCHVKWQCPSMIHLQKISKQLPNVSVRKLLHLECGMKSVHYYY